MNRFLLHVLAFLSLLLVGGGLLFAQTDVTHLIVNPDFEEDGIQGWKTVGIGPQSNTSFKLKHGTTYAEKWTGRGNKLSDTYLRQTIEGIPYGVYTVTAVGHHIQEDTPKAKQTGGYLFANNCRTTIEVDGEYEVTTTVGDGTLTLGVLLEGATGNWIAVDNFRLSYTVVADSLQPYIDLLISEAEKEDQHLSSPQQTELDNAKAALTSYVGSQETEGLVEAMVRLRNAIKAYKLSMASEEHPYDMTDAIVNPSFENNGTKGWTAVNMGAQGNDSFSRKAGSTYVECWTWRGNAVGDGSVRQVVKDLPAGNYRLTAVAQNIQEDSPTARKAGAWIYANEQKAAVYKADKYQVNFTCISGEVEIGFEAKNAQGNWIAVDNFQLWFVGASQEANLTQLQQRIEAAEALTSQHMNTDTLDILTQAIAQAKAYQEGQDMTRIAATLNDAITKAEASIMNYEQLAKAITNTQKVLDAGGENERDNLAQSIAAAQALYDDLHASNVDLAAMIPILERSLLIYRLANGSGTVPVVTIHPEVIYGCKAAVGRMKVKGSNLLEQGFCWSTNPEPTVLDSASTTYYEFNGNVYLIPDLQPSTTYYVRAYAITKKYAIGYGDVVRIITLPEADVKYSYNMAGDEATNERIDNACKTAVSYLNTWTSIRGFRPSVNYDPGDDGAHGSYGGWITIGAAFAQNPGTVMHEMGHGIGVGQHWRYTSWDSPLHPTMYWTGERANRVFAFFENQKDVYNADGTFASGGNHTVADGDRVHVCYGLSGVTAPIDLLRQAAFYQGMYEDGMPAVGDGACPFYSFDSQEGEKYYLTNEKYGTCTRFLTVLSTGRLTYKPIDMNELADNDAYAWYVNYEPKTGFYHIKNAQTGYYLTFRSGAFSTRDMSTLSSAEDIHLMPSRQMMTIETSDTTLTVKPYWLARGNRVESPEVLSAVSSTSPNLSYPQLNFYDTATIQHWAFLSAAQITALTTGIVEVNQEASKTGETIFDLSGRRVSSSQMSLKKGVYIVDGKKVWVK